MSTLPCEPRLPCRLRPLPATETEPPPPVASLAIEPARSLVRLWLEVGAGVRFGGWAPDVALIVSGRPTKRP